RGADRRRGLRWSVPRYRFVLLYPSLDSCLLQACKSSATAASVFGSDSGCIGFTRSSRHEESDMSELKLRLTANEDAASALINLMGSLEGIESVEEIADLMPHMDDADSSSAGLPDDIGPGTHLIRIEAGNDTAIRRALELAEASARDHGAALEIVNDDERF